MKPCNRAEVTLWQRFLTGNAAGIAKFRVEIDNRLLQCRLSSNTTHGWPSDWGSYWMLRVRNESSDSHDARCSQSASRSGHRRDRRNGTRGETSPRRPQIKPRGRAARAQACQLKYGPEVFPALLADRSDKGFGVFVDRIDNLRIGKKVKLQTDQGTFTVRIVYVNRVAGPQYVETTSGSWFRLGLKIAGGLFSR